MTTDVPAPEPIEPETSATPADPPREPEIDPAPTAAEEPPDDRELDLARRLEAEQQRAESWEAACRAATRDRELAGALAAQPLVPGAVEQLLVLWKDRLDTFVNQGVVKVAARDGRAVAEAVADWLAQPEFAHFCRAATRGGVAGPGLARADRTQPPQPPPRNLGEAAIQKWRSQTARLASDTSPIGLHRRGR